MKRISYNKNHVKSGVLYVYAIMFAIFNFVRVFIATFWLDETFSIMLAKMNVPDLIKMTAADAHPPLYYLILRLFYLLLGNHNYTYALASIAPVLLSIGFAVFALRKEFGGQVAVFFITLSTLMNCCLEYSTEVRMYSWGCFFVTLCFWYAYQILKQNDRYKNWILFTIFGLAAAYTHYYALVSVAFIYVGLFAILIIREWKNIRQCLICGIVTVLAYLPWLKILLESFKRKRDDWWGANIPELKDVINFVFQGNAERIIACIFFVCLVIAIIKLICTIKIDKSKKVKISLKSFKSIIQNSYFGMMFIGILAWIGVYLVGYLVSVLIRPFFLVRFTFLLMGVLWILLSSALVKTIKNKKIALFVLVFLLVFGGKEYFQTVLDEKKDYEHTQDLIEFVKENSEETDILASDMSHLHYGVLDYYFEGYTTKDIEEVDLETISERTIWLLAKEKLEQKELEKYNSYELETEYMKEGCFAKQYNYYLYRISSKNQ